MGRTASRHPRRRVFGGSDRNRARALPAAIIGNGSILASVSSAGAIERLCWPHVDWPQHLGQLKLGLVQGGSARWLDQPPFSHSQTYLPDTNILETKAQSGARTITVTDFCTPRRPLLVRRLRLPPASRVALYCRPALNETTRYGSAYVEGVSEALVFYARGVALALSLTPAGDASCGRVLRRRPVASLATLRNGSASAAAFAYGEVEGALTSAPTDEATVICAFGETPQAALAELNAALGAGADALQRERIDADARLLDQAEPSPGAEVDASLYRRSLLVLDLLQDKRTGAVIAAPELDPDFVHSGGYGFVWGRDMAFIVLAFLAAGRGGQARSALRWLASTQEESGAWLHRHWTNGSLAPSWGLLQIDETGSILHAFEAAFRELRDVTLDRELWPAVRRAADFLAGFRDPATGLAAASFDLWEEREGQHAYSSAAAAAGLAAAAAAARRHQPRLAPRYELAAAELRAAIDTALWDDRLGHHIRTLTPRDSADPAADPAIDISLLGLIWPYTAFDPASAHAQATLRAVEQRLALPGGGILRYQGDTYVGGNPWVLGNLWLALCHRATGDRAGLERHLGAAQARRTELGLLPEQFSRDGRPAWVLPLAWSHALLLLAARPELTLIEEDLRAHFMPARPRR